MTPESQKEQFSNAYLRAITAVAGYTLYKPELDDDSIDWGICARGTNDTPRAPRMELQLKCTARDMLHETSLRFPLSLKNYNDLRQRVFVPRLLVVVFVPALTEDWIRQTEEELVLRHCAYWLSLRQAPATVNRQTVTVQLP